jgi:hypothetical protein
MYCGWVISTTGSYSGGLEFKSWPLDSETSCLYRGLKQVFQSLLANDRIITQVMPQMFLSSSFPIHFSLAIIWCYSLNYWQHECALLLCAGSLEGSGMASGGGNPTLSCVRGRSGSCDPALGFTICNITTQSTRKSSEVTKYMMHPLNLVTGPYNCQKYQVIHTEISARECSRMWVMGCRFICIVPPEH